MNTQIVSTTMSDANQTAVPSLVRHIFGLSAGDRLLWRVDERRKVVEVRQLPRRWGQAMRGLGRDIWRGIDANEYVRALRKDRTAP